VKDIKLAIKEVKANPPLKESGSVAMYCSAQKFPKEFIDDAGKVGFDAILQI